jgi:hypothetical protein
LPFTTSCCHFGIIEVSGKAGEFQTQEKFEMDKQSDNWPRLPTGLKWLFALNFFSFRPTRRSAGNVEFMSHLFGFAFCVLGLISEPALVGGIILLSNAYLFHLHIWLGDKYGAWYDRSDFGMPSNNAA